MHEIEITFLCALAASLLSFLTTVRRGFLDESDRVKDRRPC